MTGKTELQRSFFLKLLQPGDLLLYRSNKPAGRIIQLKTYSKVTHSEIYIGFGRTIASRDGIGVDTYDFNHDKLALILRPIAPVDITGLVHWHVTEAKGQGYDWVGLVFGFVARKWGRKNKKMWCSEHTTRAYKNGGKFLCFRKEVDADSIAPGDLFKSAAFRQVWISSDLARSLGHEVESDLVGVAGACTGGAEAVEAASGEEGKAA